LGNAHRLPKKRQDRTPVELPYAPSAGKERCAESLSNGNSVCDVNASTRHSRQFRRDPSMAD
jgi:hypothetical protein